MEVHSDRQCLIMINDLSSVVGTEIPDVRQRHATILGNIVCEALHRDIDNVVAWGV